MAATGRPTKFDDIKSLVFRAPMTLDPSQRELTLIVCIALAGPLLVPALLIPVSDRPPHSPQYPGGAAAGRWRNATR